MKELIEYLGKMFLFFMAVYFILKILVAIVPDTDKPISQPPNHYSSSYRYRATPTPVAKKSSSSSKKSTYSSKKTNSYSDSKYREPDDSDDFYYNNRGDFESEDDAWDYMEDEPDDWD